MHLCGWNDVYTWQHGLLSNDQAACLRWCGVDLPGVARVNEASEQPPVLEATRRFNARLVVCLSLSLSLPRALVLCHCPSALDSAIVEWKEGNRSEVTCCWILHRSIGVRRGRRQLIFASVTWPTCAVCWRVCFCGGGCCCCCDRFINWLVIS